MPITQTPLRYPGGKSKLYKYVVKLLEFNALTNYCYVEPFTGGGGLALSLLIKNNVSKIIINDLDYAIYAFWFCVLNKTDDLVSMIERVPLSIAEWYRQKEIQQRLNDYEMIEVALSTLYLNRTNRSGIIKGGIIGGIEQKGQYKVHSRFNKNDLIRKIKVISALKAQISLYNLDIFNFIPEIINGSKNSMFIYFDPPYVCQGGNLYRNYFSGSDHEKLSVLIKNIKCPWLLTYDNHQIVRKMYEDLPIKQVDVNYIAGPCRVGKELMIYSSNLLPV